MIKSIKLSNAVKYSCKRINIDAISVEDFISTDNLLQNKLGKENAIKLPALKGLMPGYNNDNILVGNIRPYLRKIWFSDKESGCSADVLVFEVNKFHYPKFVYYTLFRDDFFDHMMKGSKGTKMPRGDKKQILDFLIPDFEFEEQQKIAKVLSDLDAKIEINNRISSELEAMAKTLYDYWFVQFDFPDANGTSYKSSGGKMIWNEELKREIPEGWKDGTFGDYCKSTGGFAFKSIWWAKEGLKVVKIKDIQEDNTINLNNLSCAKISIEKIDEKFKARPGNVLIAMTGATVGKFAIIPYTENPLFVNQRVGYFNLGENPIERLSFLINSLNQRYFRDAIFTLASGAAQPNISNDQINNIPLLIPSNKLVQKFNKILSANYSRILINQKENQELASLRDWLLPMLMNGQVSVVDVEEQLGMVAEGNVEYKKS